MKIVIAGGTGFLGRPLADALLNDAHTLVQLSRSSAADHSRGRHITWKPDGSAGAWASEIDGADVVMNLAGESIAGRRWTAEQKRRIVDSRVRATKSLVAAIGQATTRPSLLVN